MIMYIPFGLILLLLRLCISLQTTLYLMVIPDVFPLKKYFLRVFQGVLGIVVTTSDTEELSEDAKVAVVNKVSGFDHLIFPALFQTKTVSSPPTTAILSRLVNHCSLRAEDDQAMIREAEKFVPADAQDGRASLPPLTFQPEAVPTNGSSILMKFDIVPFSLTDTIQPVLLRVTRPIGFGVSVSTARSGGWEDLLWTFFLPYTHFHFQVLPTVTRDYEESSEHFATRVQNLMADGLSVQPTDYARGDVDKWLEEMRVQEEEEEPRQRQEDQLPFIPINEYRDVVEPLQQPRDYHMEYQIDQVHQVFPQVPRYAIRQDLMRTRSLDATVLNVADGRLQYDQSTDGNPPRARSLRVRQEEQLAARASATAQRRPPPLPQPVVKPLPDMGKMSLEEKKKALIETAKARYLARHSKSKME